MARTVIKAQANGVWGKGDIIQSFADGVSLGSKVVLPSFGVVDTPGVLISAVKQYEKPWQFQLDYSQVWSEAQKGYRITAWAIEADSSGAGAITKPKLQNYLDRWNCVFQSASANQVIFDLGIYQSAISEGFWMYDVTDFEFAQIQYVDNVCRVQADYSATQIGGTPIERKIEKLADEIISHDGVNKIITFDINRSTVVSRFKAVVADTLNGQVSESRRRYYFNSAFVDTVIAAGGVYETNKTTAVANIEDRTNS